jgi:predicted peptidase
VHGLQVKLDVVRLLSSRFKEQFTYFNPNPILIVVVESDPMKAKSLLGIIILLGVAVSGTTGFAQDVLDRFEAKTYTDANGEKLLYRELAPKLESGKKYPLVIFLHGAGERGDDNKVQLVHGMKDFASDQNMKNYPAFVIAPQCPNEKKWAEVDWSKDSHTTPAEPSTSMRLCHELIEKMVKELPIDADRIYITGLSMGGYGTWDALSRWPDLFAAALPICGGGDDDPEVVEKFKHVPIWVVHGDKDEAVKVERSRKMVKALEVVGGKPIYTEMKGVGHDSWTATYANPETFKWMFSQKKSHAKKK